METLDINNHVDAALVCMNDSSWKVAPQQMFNSILDYCVDVDDSLQDQTYTVKEGSEFVQDERGKKRYIFGNDISDRIVSHSLCDNVLTDALEPYLINNNCASRKDNGISKTRYYFERDLHNFYLKYGHNNGYILLIDFSKFYDNIDHEILKSMIHPKIPEDCRWLFDRILESFEVDVSYMTDEEYAKCLDVKFDSLEYHANIPKSQRSSREKMMAKSAKIGNQVSQNIGVFYPTPVDNYYRIVKGLKWSGRYMDDIYIISNSREELQEVLAGIREVAEKYKIFLNAKKTKIYPISKSFVFLQTKYYLEPNGRVVKRITSTAITRERRRLKKYKNKLELHEMPYEDIEQAYKSWMGSFAPLMSKVQVQNMQQLFKELFGKETRWKRQKSHSRTATKSPWRKTELATS